MKRAMPTRRLPLRFVPAAAVCAALTLVACTRDDPAQPQPNVEASKDVADASDPTPATITLEKIGGFAGGGVGAAEITAYDVVSQRLFVVNGALGTVDVLDLSDPTQPVKVGSISVAQFGSGANSVAADRGVVALGIQASVKTNNGTVAFYQATTLRLISSVTVGALPDMVTFTPSGRFVLCANEGEPDDNYLVDPEGSVSIIDVSNINSPSVRTAGFGAWIGQESALRATGIRVFGPGANAAQDLEPEYIAVSEDDVTAFVTLQENNALAVIDIASAAVRELIPLGYKDHTLSRNKLDASDRDGAINIRNWPVRGMYQPDAIAAYDVQGQTYLVTANEGDAREYLGVPGFVESARVSTLALNPTTFSSAVCGGSCQSNALLGRLTVTTTLGKNPATNQYDALYVFGGRSFSIWTAAGQQVWDSGAELEERTSALSMVPFNAGHENATFDDRSDNKGPEPEGVVLARFGEKTFAFIGLERVGGVMVYDVTTPASPRYVTYVNTRNGASGDLGPEGLFFVPARRAPGKHPLLIVGHEISGTSTIYRIHLE